MKTLIRGGWLYDGIAANPILDGYVLVEGDRIAEVGQGAGPALSDVPAILDLPDHTLVPGLVDVHSHVSIHTLGHEAGQVSRRELEITVDALSWLRADLDSGVTLMRTLGDPDFMDIALRKAQMAGRIEAPRLKVAGNLVQSSHVKVSVSKSTCDGPDSIRQAVRSSIRAGCDWVKFYSTPASRTPNPVLPIFSEAEVDVIFQEARRAGFPVSVHCHGGAAADWCIERNVDSLEHGLFLERRQMAAMAERGITLVPTVGVILLQDATKPSPELARARDKANTYLTMAREEGVRCIPGTDAVHGRLHFEVEMLVAGGWKIGEAISAVTSEAAKLLGVDDAGKLQSSALADVVAVRGDLSSDIARLAQVDLVMQGGAVKFDRTKSNQVH